MICQFCEKEYPAETQRCEQCGCELVEALPEEGFELALEWLCETTHRRQLALLVERLDAEDIPYVVHAGTGLRMQESQALRRSAQRGEWTAMVLIVSARQEEARAAWTAALEQAVVYEDEEEGEDEPGDGRFDTLVPR